MYGGGADAASIVKGVRSVINNLQHVSSGASFSESKYFNGSINLNQGEIRRGLNSPAVEAKLDAMRRLLAAEASSDDPNVCVDLFSEVVKIMSTTNLELKRLVYIWIVSHAEARRELALLSVNSFQKDSVDSRSALVRAASLRSMAAIRVLEMIQVVMAAVNQAAVDSSAYVRKSVAAVCLPQVFVTDIDQFALVRNLLVKMMATDGSELVVGAAAMSYFVVCIQLYGLVQDDEEHEGSSAGTSKQEIIQDSLGMLHGVYPRLIKLLPLMDPFGQYYTIELLHRYCRLHFTRDRVHDHCRMFLEVLTSRVLLSAARFVVHLACCVVWDLGGREYATIITAYLMSSLALASGTEATETLLKTIYQLLHTADSPSLFKPYIRKFFLKSYDSPLVADMKLSILQSLLDASTVDEILSELQTYVRWHHRPGLSAFLAKVMSLIVHIAIRYQSASDRIMAGLVNMLDSTCPSLANEAAVAVREIVEHRKRRGDPSNTKKVLTGLSRALESLTTPAARASVVWLLAQTDGLCVCAYTVVDTFRLLVKGWTGEEEMVKQQILVLGMRLWAFHQLNSLRVADRSEPLDAKALKSEQFPPAISSQLLPRLCSIVSYLLSLAMAEDHTAKPRLCSAARILTAMRDSYAELCQGGWERVTATTDEMRSDLQRLARGYLHAHLPRWLTGSSGGESLLVESAAPPPTGVDACRTTEVYTQSLSFVLGTPMVGCEVMMEFDPDRAADGEGERQEAFDALQRSATRTRSRERERIIEPVARSFSSGDANRQHTASRVHVPSGISRPAPVVETLADLDLFYSHEPQGGLEEGEAPSCGTSEGYEGAPADTDGLPKPAEPTVDLASLFAAHTEEQGVIRNTGEVVTGEDTESSEGDEDDD